MRSNDFMCYIKLVLWNNNWCTSSMIELALKSLITFWKCWQRFFGGGGWGTFGLLLNYFISNISGKHSFLFILDIYSQCLARRRWLFILHRKIFLEKISKGGPMWKLTPPTPHDILEKIFDISLRFFFKEINFIDKIFNYVFHNRILFSTFGIISSIGSGSLVLSLGSAYWACTQNFTSNSSNSIFAINS
jgi:hypothetical protein